MTDTQSTIEQFISVVREAFGLDPSPETLTQLRWALSRVGRQNHGDLVAAIFLACYEMRDEPERPLVDADLRRIIWRVVKDASRQAARVAKLDPSRVHVPAPSPPPEEAVSVKDEVDRVLSAVENLPLEDQAAFVRLMEGASAEEIAREFEMTSAAVRQRLHRARKRIRQVLDAQ
jgi:RNA polymerase sigma factor (sigma-70 family)